MNVRIATDRDIPAIACLIQQLAAHDHATPPDRDTLVQVLHTLLARDNTLYVVAEAKEGGPLLGVMQLDFRLTTWEAAPYAYVEDFIVDEAHRGMGIGSAMLDLAERLARERGCVRMDLDVLQESVDSQRFYARHGFVDQRRLYLRRVLGPAGS
jgi:ribosomal protein S18 acetylase RimI-like enzyme